MRTFTVLLSHRHLDHVAGTAAFADCEVIATGARRNCSRRTGGDRGRRARGSARDRPADPADPVFDERLHLDIGGFASS